MPAPEIAATFLADLFGGSTTESVFLCSLPNDRGGSPGEKRLLTRESEKIEHFVSRWDQPGRSLYFCTGTIIAGAAPERRGGSPRNKSNVAETPIAWADIDYKGIIDDAPEALSAVQGLMHPPSAIVASGHGLHLYWLLREAAGPDERPRLETLLRSLADLVAGDPAVCETARLMRLPGSTNSKIPGEAIPVEILNAKLDRRYEIADLEDMCTTMPPILTRMPVTREVANPWLAVASQFGFKPPVDIEQRLAAMHHHAADGESSIHTTQLYVSAVLLNRGMPRDQVVALLLDATAAALGEEAKTWNWQVEKHKIENMCNTWIPKSERAREAQAENEPETARTGNGTVINLADRRERPGASKKADVPLHIIVARAVIEAMPAHGTDLIFTRDGTAYAYADGLWTMLVDKALRAHLDHAIETACRALSLHSSTKLVNDARQYITRDPDLARDPAWDSHGMIPTQSGLLDIKTGKLVPAAPEHFATWRVDAPCDPIAQCPLWLRMVNETFSDRDDEDRAKTIDVIQEMLGVALIDGARRQLSKGMILQGPPDCGKSEILDVLAGMFGGNPIAAPLDTIDATHGLMPFARRSPWVLHEAFQPGKWHFSALVKSIVTHNPVSINMKNGPILTRVIRSPIFWGTNYPPQFKEATRAIINRFIIISCRRTFQEGENAGIMKDVFGAGFERPAELVLERERAGLLNWAIRGLARARARGFLKITSDMLEASEDVRRDSNLVSGFVEEHIRFDPAYMLSVPDFCAAFVIWHEHFKGEGRSPPAVESIGKAVSSLGDPRIGISRKELRDNSRRYYAGIKLDPEGLKLWERAIQSDRYANRSAFTTPAGEPVNKIIPTAWCQRVTVVQMQNAHLKNGHVTDPPTVTQRSPRRSPTQPFDPSYEPPF